MNWPDIGDLVNGELLTNWGDSPRLVMSLAMFQLSAKIGWLSPGSPVIFLGFLGCDGMHSYWLYVLTELGPGWVQAPLFARCT
jgi:hypothetical protein